PDGEPVVVALLACRKHTLLVCFQVVNDQRTRSVLVEQRIGQPAAVGTPGNQRDLHVTGVGSQGRLIACFKVEQKEVGRPCIGADEEELKGGGVGRKDR